MDDFRAYLERVDEHWERDPAAVVGALAGVSESDAERRSLEVSLLEGQGTADAILTLDGLFDDSVRALRYEVYLQRRDDGTWDVLTAFRTQRCHRGRGHQAFSPEPCV